jgi:proton glutamate symport protein
MSKAAAVLKNPWIVLLSIAAGVAFGTFLKPEAIALAPIGDMYLFLIQMCVLPILVTAIVSSLTRIMKNRSAKGYLGRMVLVFVTLMLLMSATGAIAGLISQPGKNLDDKTIQTLGKIINATKDNGVLEMSLNDPSADVVKQKASLFDFLKEIVPSNIFNALGNGRALEIVFFAIIFGIVLGFIKDQNAELVVHFMQSLLEAFQKLITWAMYGLPFALIILIGGQVAQVGPEMFLAMTKFIGVFYLTGCLLFIFCTVILWIRSGLKNPLQVFKAMIDPIMISFATRNSFAALPASISSLQDRLKLDPTATNLMLPLGTTICRFGNIFYFALAAVFVAQLYNTPIGIGEFTIIILGAVLAGTATAGASGLLTLPMIGFVLAPLGLPVEAILIIFMAVDSIIDPMRTFLIVYVNAAGTALIAPKVQAT